jgi:hypothetical protein
MDAPHPGRAVALEQMQLLEPLENPEGEIDLDAGWIENLSVEIVRQSFANQQLVDFGAPARSRWIGGGIDAEQSDSPAWHGWRGFYCFIHAPHRHGISVIAGYLICQ